MSRVAHVAVIASCALLLSGVPLHGAEGGLSNYIPAFYGDLALATEPPDGWSFRNDLFCFGGDVGRSLRSGEIRVKADVDLVYDYVSILYKPGFKIFGTPVAFSVTLTLGNVDIEADVAAGPLFASVDDQATGLGDTTVGAYAYWNRKKFHYAWNNYIVAPTGEYDVDDLSNPSLNYWTFETDLALTYLDEAKGRDYSVVVGYGYNTENRDTDYRSGDEIHLDFVLNQLFSESFGLGIIGYFYRQVGGDGGAGAILGGFHGEGAGVGPAIYFSRKMGKKDVYFIAKWLHDYHAENRIRGDYAYVSFALSF